VARLQRGAGAQPAAHQDGLGRGHAAMQAVERWRDPALRAWDAPRTARMCVYGGLWLSPFLHAWYRGLDAMFVGRTGLSVTLGKLALDQSFAATTNMVMFYSINSLLDGASLAETRARIEDRLWPTLKSLWCLWIPVQSINLSLVPLDKRVLVVNFVGVGWSMFMSWFGNQPSRVAAPVPVDVVVSEDALVKPGPRGNSLAS